MRARPGRLHHLDALRALAMVLILPVHALDLIGIRDGWNDVEASIFWVLHAFRMPLFFMIAGFFGALMVEVRGGAELLRNRAIQIGIPLVLGTIFVVPLLTVCTHAVSGEASGPGSSGPLAALAALEPSYLWFLWYLVLFYAASLVGRRALSPRGVVVEGAKSAGGRFLANPIAPLLLAMPTALLLYRQPTWIVETTPAQSFVPVPELLAFYGIFFLAGWMLFVTPGLRETIESRPRRYVLLSSFTLPPALALYLLQGNPTVGEGRFFHILALLLLCTATWSMVLGLLGLSRRYLGDYSPRMRYWADASYWIYLSHFLPMAVFALALTNVAMPWTTRVALLSSTTLALIYLAYGAFVRHTPIGHVLHGPRSQRTVRRAAFTPPKVAAAPPA